jgi:hypothetical protein
MTRRRREQRFPAWGNGRDDGRDYARLAASLGPELRPVSPPRDGRKLRHIDGQLRFFWAP